MRHSKFSIEPNEYFTTNLRSNLLDILFDGSGEDIDYGYIFLSYPNWRRDQIDLFQYIHPDFLHTLRTESSILIVDYTYEGFSSIQCPIIEILEKNCLKHNIDPKKIFYFSGNLRDSSQTINVIPMFLLDYNSNWKIIQNLNQVKTDFLQKNKNDIILSLSRRNRSHRVLAHAMLTHSELNDYSIISQDTCKNLKIDDNTLSKAGLTSKQWKQFQKQLPRIANKNDFHINAVFDHFPTLHNHTCFSIVNETEINDFNNTSMFFSEKILKPIINFQPFVIYGQRGINHALCELGYKPYGDYFDLSFDREENNILRYKKLLENITTLTKRLASSSIEEQLDWRFKHIELLEYNYNIFLQQHQSVAACRCFLDRVSQL
jgi:hypothetical protein